MKQVSSLPFFRLHLNILSYLLSVQAFSQSDTASKEIQGCGYTCSLSKNEVCFGDSFILDTYWHCNISPTYYDFEVYDGIVATKISEEHNNVKYSFSFAGPGNVSFRFNYQFYKIMVHPLSDLSTPLSQTVFCKDAPLFVLTNASAPDTLYLLDTTNVMAIDPFIWNTGQHTLTRNGKNKFGCRYTSSQVITITEACELSQSAIVYPNPAKEYVTISADKSTGIHLSDMNGKIWIETIALLDSTKLMLDNIPSGLYILEFVCNGKTAVRKLVRQ